MTELIKRVQAVEAMASEWSGVRFAWGKKDCARLAAAHIKAMGHKVSLVKFGTYGSELGAFKALKRGGFDSLEDLVDGRFVRIAPAYVRVGDLVGLQSGDDRWPALSIALGHGRVLGFLDGRAGVLAALQIKTAWSVPCLKP